MYVLFGRKFWMKLYVSCIKWKMKSLTVSRAYTAHTSSKMFIFEWNRGMKNLIDTFNDSWDFYCWVQNSLKCCVPLLQPSDKKSAESVHPNLIWATVGGEREEELEEDGHADAQTRGPGECSLNVSVTSRCHEASCRDVVPTFESAGQRKWKKEKQRRGESGFMRQRSRGNGKMDKESLKGLMNSNRGGKIY